MTGCVYLHEGGRAEGNTCQYLQCGAFVTDECLAHGLTVSVAASGLKDTVTDLKATKDRKFLA